MIIKRTRGYIPFLFGIIAVTLRDTPNSLFMRLHHDVRPDDDEQNGKKVLPHDIEPHIQAIQEQKQQTDGHNDPAADVLDPLKQGAGGNDDQQGGPASAEGEDIRVVQDNQNA